jgi:hypothetical protein
MNAVTWAGVIIDGFSMEFRWFRLEIHEELGGLKENALNAV